MDSVIESIASTNGYSKQLYDHAIYVQIVLPVVGKLRENMHLLHIDSGLQ